MAPVLNRRLVLEAPSRLADGSGGFQKGWAALGVLWGAVEEAAPREGSLPGAVVGEGRLRVTVRAAAPGAPSRPVAGQRLREGGRAFVIERVAEEGLLYLRLTAREEVAR